ncbi:MAG: hypothetical protein C4K48_08960 [Candidatus Thorarchaeota archaeon]|nr:MAG: hypothetical protein C4K48_08960 [Candidatus Thorarchaeota archaeon]
MIRPMEPISSIDTSSNQLYFRGLNAVRLAKEQDYESVLFLLVHGQLPTARQHDSERQRLIELRALYSSNMNSIENLVRALQSIRDEDDLQSEDLLLAFVALAPLALSSQLAGPKSRRMNTQNEKLGHAANLLWMISGEMPSEEDIKEFDTCLILHMDDPDNPSLTALFTSLISGASVTTALESALSEHVRPSHHGAGLETMRMILAIGKKDNASDYLRTRLNSGQKISGLGHRIYRGVDPRAVVLREILGRRTKGTEEEELFRIAEEVADQGSSLLHEYKGIDAYPNVDLYNALTYFTFGFPPELNTELFAVSRAAGWMAHILEWKQHP